MSDDTPTAQSATQAAALIDPVDQSRIRNPMI